MALGSVTPLSFGWFDDGIPVYLGWIRGEERCRARVATPADYVFASPALAEKLRRCLAFSPTKWYAFSDHSPIVATFED